MTIKIVDLPIKNGDWPIKMVYHLVGGWPSPLKNEVKVSWDDDYSQYMGKLEYFTNLN